jgi:hypothetical protein
MTLIEKYGVEESRVNRNDDADDIPALKDCVNGLIQIRDDLKRFIPQKKNESTEAG